MPPQVTSQIAGVKKTKTAQDYTDEELEKEYEAETSIGRKGELNQERTRRKSIVPKPTPPPPTGTGNASGIEEAPERKFEEFPHYTGHHRGGKGEEKPGIVTSARVRASNTAAPGVMKTKHDTAREAMVAKYNAMPISQLQSAHLNVTDMGELAIIREILAKRSGK